MDLDKLNEQVEQGYLRSQAHPYLPYQIFNYTEKTNYEGAWNDITLACRGLILDDSGELIARPFPKFFNYGQSGAPVIDSLAEVVVTDKVDGSLGILYPTPTGHAIATRGSFTSDQAEHATKLWRDRYADTWQPKGTLTYLFEIVYPANRIVVDYGDLDLLVLLGAVETGTGNAFHPRELDWPGAAADTFQYRTFADALTAEPRPNAEGLVVYVKATGDRVKIKQADYIRLHKIVTCLNARAVWEVLAAGSDFDAFVAGLPDEFHDWANDVAFRLTEAVEDVQLDATKEYEQLLSELPEVWSRKDFALRAAKHPLKAHLFALLDGKDILPRLWRDAKPDHGWTPSGRTFSEDNA